jgi:hypothetical protein
VAAAIVSDQELMFATRDAHVGVSKDGGKTWQRAKLADTVKKVAGSAGGPYFALHDGALSMSADGSHWRRLPRYGADTLIDLVAAELGVVAIGKSGGFFHLERDGSFGGPEHEGTLPDKFKPKALVSRNGLVLAWSGKSGYATTDGKAWTKVGTMPALPDLKSFATSAGNCAIGKVGKAKGVVCSVAGLAYGVGDVFLVENKGSVSLTSDGGDSWEVAALPFKGANGIFGAKGGPYYAVGDDGALAVSKDGGASWDAQAWDRTANLQDGIVDGQTIILVGAGASIVVSKDGGATWSDAEPPPVGKNFSWIGKVGDQFVASDGRAFVASRDGTTWAETEAVELPAKVGDCGDDGPEDRARCRWRASVTTPQGLPDIRGLTFNDDVGIAYGDGAFVAVTTDGGATWSESHGLGLGRYGAIDFALRGERMLATDGAQLVVSTDTGATWNSGRMARKYAIQAVHVAASGAMFAATRDDVIAAKVEPTLWLPAAKAQLKADWRAIFEIGGVIYVAGSKGQLVRSEDGNEWSWVQTGSGSPVIAMAGEGDEVWAVTAYSRRANNLLLRSEDGGRHFILVGEAPSVTDDPDLRFQDGAVHWADLASRDHGETWRRERARYFSGLVDVADGSGLAITNLVYRYGSDRLYAVTGPGENDWVRIESAFTEGGRIHCDAASGCWMLASGVLYRPVDR